MNLLPVQPEYTDYLRDESRRVGNAESIVFPTGEEEVAEALQRAALDRRPVTIQGARTGLTAGAVPEGGIVVNVGRMDRIAGLGCAADGRSPIVTVQPGVVLSSLRAWLRKKGDAQPALFFTPDPTETSATIGGMIACNASGARSFLYGPTRCHVEALRVVLASGDVLALRRGEQKARELRFRVVSEQGRVFEGELPRYNLPATKNASGYYTAPNMDAMDLFIGSEGTLGVVTSADLRLTPWPAVVWGVTVFLPSDAAAPAFVRTVRNAGALRPAAVEYFDARALDLLRRRQAEGLLAESIPALPESGHCAVYVEYHAAQEASAMSAVEALSLELEKLGGDEQRTWMAMDEREMERLLRFRHLVPETVNAVIDERRKTTPGLTKLGTDMAVPDDRLEAVLELYRRDLAAAGLDYVMFGHIGNNHLHVNILPRSAADYEAGKGLYLRWAEQVILWGGTVSAEHGIGKMKTALLRAMYGEEGVAQMRAVKKTFDPDGWLNRGNVFDGPD